MSKNKRWFKTKRYGYGWTPASKIGWIVTLFYALLSILLLIRIERNSQSATETLLAFTPAFLLLTLGFVLVCYFKSKNPD